MYQHRVQYYETDKMQVTHHSNYIRWMEEARVDYLEKVGWPYTKLEELGIISPVISVDAKYKKSTTFNDLITIEVKVQEFRGVKLKLSYMMTNQNGEAVCEGHSEHCFLNGEGKPLMLKNSYPEFNEVLLRELAAQE